MINYKEFERMELLQLQASLCEKFDSTTADYCQASAILWLYSTINLDSNCTMVILLLSPESRNKSIHDNIIALKFYRYKLNSCLKKTNLQSDLASVIFTWLQKLAAVFYFNFQNQHIWKGLSGTPSECQKVWIQIKPDILSDLIWVQTVCKNYQQTTLVEKDLIKWNIVGFNK